MRTESDIIEEIIRLVDELKVVRHGPPVALNLNSNFVPTTPLEKTLTESIKKGGKAAEIARAMAEERHAPPLSQDELTLWLERLGRQTGDYIKTSRAAKAYGRPEKEFKRIFYWLKRAGYVEFDEKKMAYKILDRARPKNS